MMMGRTPSAGLLLGGKSWRHKIGPGRGEADAPLIDHVAVGFGGSGGYLEMNVYKPLIIFNVTHSTTTMSDGCVNFRKFLIERTKPNLKKTNEYVARSLMLVTAFSPVIGYDKASKIAQRRRPG